MIVVITWACIYSRSYERYQKTNEKPVFPTLKHLDARVPSKEQAKMPQSIPRAF